MPKLNLSFWCTFLLVLLWLHAAGSKLADFTKYERSMRLQTPLHLIAEPLIWILPLLEAGIALALVNTRTKLTGFYTSFVLLFCFTVYIAMIVLDVFPQEPCSCGGIIRQFNWRQHLVFNVFFLAVSLTGIMAEIRQTKEVKQTYHT